MDDGNRIENQNNNNEYNGNQFDERDDRDEVTKYVHRSRNNRRASFKPSGTGTGGRQFNNKPARNVNLAIRTTITDFIADFPTGMNRDGNYQRNEYTRISRCRYRTDIPWNHRTGYGQSGMRKLFGGTTDWFLVTIPHGQKYDKEFIIKCLEGLVESETFNPLYVKVESSALCFYVDDIKMAQKLLDADRRFTLPDGFKLIIRVRHNIPQVQIDANLTEKMKLAMAKRFDPTTKALDMKNFHNDVDLKDIFCALFRSTIMMTAIDIIAENIPDLEALDLSDNKLYLIEHLRCMAKKLPSLKILHLANNRIPSLNALDALRQCQLIDLALKGNPLKDRLREQTVYISEIRKKFPKLQTLDFVTLPPKIGFDIPDVFTIPSPKSSYICDNNGADIVYRFLEQYFTLFDSDNRLPLLDAYHENAMFSLTSYYSQNRLAAYLPHNRNILRLKDFDARSRQLKIGRLPIVSFLSELPITQHDPHSFAIDLSLYKPEMMLLTVTGVFREREKPIANICSFQRTLMIVPYADGVCIKNEMLHINYATMVQIKAAFKSKPSSTDDITKLQMIQMIAQLSNMNLEWSEKCLTETNWNFDKAASEFNELNNQQKIPPEAFPK